VVLRAPGEGRSRHQQAWLADAGGGLSAAPSRACRSGIFGFVPVHGAADEAPRHLAHVSLLQHMKPKYGLPTERHAQRLPFTADDIRPPGPTRGRASARDVGLTSAIRARPAGVPNRVHRPSIRRRLGCGDQRGESLLQGPQRFRTRMATLSMIGNLYQIDA
jgi:hypothetical protein